MQSKLKGDILVVGIHTDGMLCRIYSCCCIIFTSIYILQMKFADLKDLLCKAKKKGEELRFKALRKTATISLAKIGTLICKQYIVWAYDGTYSIA